MYSLLYIDDEPGLLEIGRIYLENTGDFSVATALSGREGLDELRKHDFDAIVADYQMPEMDGIELLKNVRKLHGNIPFILFTGRGREEVVIEAINNGVDFYLQKGGDPLVQFTELAHKIRQAVNRRRAEIALSESEKRLADIINFLPDATFAIDTNGKVIAWNRAIEEMTGIPASDMLGRGEYEYAVPFYGERRPILIDLIFEPEDIIAKKYEHIGRRKDILSADTTLPRPKGNQLTLMGMAGPLYDRQGKLIGAIESIRDITDRKRAMEALNESERRFRELADLLPQGIYEADTSGRITYVNRLALEMFGYTAEDIEKGLNALIVIALEDRKQAGALFRQIAEEGPRSQVSAEYMGLRKDGSRFPVSIFSSSICRDGRITGVRGVIMDITERKKAEESLVSANKEYTNLLEQIQDVYYRADTDGRLVRASRSMASLLGYDDISECIGKNIADSFYFNPDDRKQLIEEINRLGKVVDYEVRLKKKDGTPVLIETSSHLYYDSAGNIISVEGTFRDITQKKRAEEELRAANEQLVVSDEELKAQYEELAKSEKRIRMSEARLTYMLGFYEYAQKGEKVLLGYAIEGAGIVTGSSLGYLAFLNEDESELSMYAWSKATMAECSMREKPIVYKTEKTGLWGEAVRQRRPVITNDYAAPNPAKKGYPDGHPHIIRHMNIPVIDEGRVVLVAGVANKPSDYTENDVSELLLLMQGLWTILKRRRLQEEQKAAYEQLAAAEEELRAQYDELAKSGLRLRESESQFRELAALLNDTFMGIKDGISILDTSMTVIRVNQTMETWYSHELPLTGRKCWEVYHGRSSRCDICPSYRTLQTGQPARDTVPLVDAGKQAGWLELYSFPLINSSTGELTGIIEYVRNITAEKQAQDELKAAYEQLSATDEELRQQYGELALSEQRVRESEEKYRLLADMSPEMVYLVDTAGYVRYVNQAAARQFHAAPDNLYGKHLSDIFPPALAQKHLEAIRKVVGERQMLESEVIEEFPTGKVYISARIVPVLSDKGKVIGVLGISNNITERKRAEESLRESEAKFRAVIDQSFEFIGLMSTDGILIVANRSALEFAGIPESDVLNRPFWETPWWTHSGELQERLKDAVRRAAAGETVRFEATHPAADGHIATIDFSLKPVVDAAGKILYLIPEGRDITERKHAEEAIRNSEAALREKSAMLEALFNAIPDVIGIQDLHHGIIRYNAAGYEMVGKNPDEVAGKRCFELIGHDAPCEICATSETYRTKKPATVQKYVPELNAWLDVRSYPVLDETGEIRYIIEHLRDITDRKQAEDSLRESEEKYRTLVESSFDGIAIHQDGIIVYANRTAARLLGSDDPGVFIGKPAIDLVAPAFRELIAKRIQQSPEKEPELIREQFLRLDGTPIDVDVTTTPSIWNGRPAAYVTFRDITAQVRAEDALRESEEKYRMLVEKSQDGIAIVQDESLVFVNGTLMAMVGYSEEELLGHAVGEFVAPEDAGIVLARHRERMSGRDVVSSYEFSLLHKDGRSRIRVKMNAGIAAFQGRPAMIATFQNVTLERQREEAVRESEARFRELTELLPQIVFEMDTTMMITFVNRQAYTALGYTPDDIAAGFNAFSIIDPAQHDRVRENIKKLVTQEPFEHLEYTFIRKDGSTFPALVYADPIHKDGELTGFRGIIIDISDRKHAEEALRESEEKYRMLVEQSQDGVFIIQDGRLVFYNKALVGLTGYTTEELDGRLLSDLLAPEDREMVISRARDRAMGKEVPELYDFSLLHKDGINRTRVRVRAGLGTYRGRSASIGMFFDVTEDRRREEALRESEARFRELTELLPQIVFELDTDMMITFVNRQAYTALGYTPDEVKAGINALSCIDPSQHDLIRTNIKKMLRKEPFEHPEYTFIRKDGSTFPALIYADPVFRDGELAGFRGIIIDISEMKRAENALRESEEKYRTLVEINRDIIYTLSTDGTILYVSPQTIPQLGYRPDEMEGRSFSDFVHPDDLQGLVDHIQEHFNSGKPARSDQFRLRRRDGTYRWYVDKTIYATDSLGRHIIAGTIRDITEEKAAQDALRESEEKYRALVESTSDFIWEVDAEGRYTYVSPQVRRMLGYDPEELIGKTPFDIMPAGEEERMIGEFWRCVELRLPLVALENKATRKDGSVVILETSGVVRTAKDGSFLGYRGIDRDITMRKQADEALKESEARLSSILHGSPILQFVIDRNHRVISWNKALEEYSGISAEDMVGTDQQWRAFYPEKRPVLADLLINKDMDTVSRLYAGKFKKSRYVEGAFEATDFFPHMGSSGVWLSFTAAPIRDEQGTIIGAVETLEDVTERINAENALRESEEWIRTILNTAQAGIVLVDAATHRIVDANKKALGLIGRDRDSVIGAVCHHFICPTEQGRCPVTDLGQQVDTSERVLINAAGETIPVLKTVVPVSIHGRSVLVESFVDISEQKRSEAAIREANRKLNLLNSITRHDIRNQLMVAQGYTQLAGLANPDATITDFLAKISAAIETIQRQIEFTRTYQELGVHAPSWFSVRRVISSVRPGRIALRNTCSAVEIFADPMIDKVFFNLFDNAMKYGTQVTEVTVGCKERERGLVITFADNGSGIPPGEKEKIFEKGYGKNTGLGLFLAREILAITGITIHETGTCGEGAVFEITVPEGSYRNPE